MVWTLRAAMNVAALQCEFEPTLLTRTNYNAMLKDHKAELAASIDTLLAYFVRTNGKNKRQGHSALDHFSTVIYSSRSEEHTSELQSLMRISYAVFCLKNKNTQQ